MKNFLNRWLVRLGLLLFIPYYFIAILLAAPRMVVDWELRRDWCDDFSQWFERKTWSDTWDVLKAGRV